MKLTMSVARDGGSMNKEVLEAIKKKYPEFVEYALSHSAYQTQKKFAKILADIQFDALTLGCRATA